VGERFLGIVVQPKLRRPIYCLGSDDRDPELRIERGDPERSRDYPFKSMGRGYLDSGGSEYAITARLSGFPRAHTPGGVTERSEGYGTCLYTGLVLLAAAESEGLISLRIEGSGAGISSTSDGDGGRSYEASRWWSAASERGLIGTESHDADQQEVEQEEDDVNLMDYTTSRTDQKLLEAISDIVNDYGDIGYVTRLRSINVDIVRTTYEESSIDVDVYTLAAAERAKLVALRTVADMSQMGWMREPDFEGEAYKDVLVALDYAFEPPQMVEKLMNIARDNGATEAEVRDVLLAARYARMAEIGREEDVGEARSVVPASFAKPRRERTAALRMRSFVERLSIPSAGPRELSAAAHRVAERQADLGWDALEDLP